MIIVTIAGALGKDAETKTTQGGDQLCTFSVAGSVGYGDRKQTIWFDVTKWGKGADALSRMLLKGTKVTVSGELSQREYEGKTYLQVRADHVALQGERQPQQSGQQSRGGGGGSPAYQDDLDDDCPFVTANPSYERRVG